MFEFLKQGAIERMWEFVGGHRLPKVLGLFLIGYYIGRNRLYARLNELRPLMKKGVRLMLPWALPHLRIICMECHEWSPLGTDCPLCALCRQRSTDGSRLYAPHMLVAETIRVAEVGMTHGADVLYHSVTHRHPSVLWHRLRTGHLLRTYHHRRHCHTGIPPRGRALSAMAQLLPLRSVRVDMALIDLRRMDKTEKIAGSHEYVRRIPNLI